jgi:CBS domain-containing protein
MAVTVASLMTPEPVVVDAETDLLRCARLMRDREIGSVGVVLDGRLSGVLTDRDIVTRAVAGDRDPRSIPVSDIATPDVITVSGNATVEEAEERMTKHAVRRLFVVDEEGRAVGIISADDLTAFRYPNSVVAEQLGEWGLGLSDQGFTGHG